MKKVFYIWRFALLAALSISVIMPSAWAYAQVSSGAGLEQSPIDIRKQDLTFVEHLPQLGFSYGTKVALDLINTGSPGEFATVRANVQAGDGELCIGGATYKLLQFHWHTPGEHLRQGHSFPIEMHLVHQAADGSLAVVGVWIMPGREHTELAKIFANLPTASGEHRAVNRFNLTTLLPQNLESYRYMGSLTTPNFDEGVRWNVLAKPIEMSPQQIAAFKAIFPEGNSREVQPLNGRAILTDVELDD
ncbi:MAG TPA: carbonic anhydrase family protein [Blastocatellia bacterium]|jgi:carbonic anhydrase|nr:carbonic anhydrase family protein [Blastocatellia bacterium]